MERRLEVQFVFLVVSLFFKIIFFLFFFFLFSQATAPLTPLVKSLREELYCERYEDIDWAAQRFNVSSLDVYYPHTWLNRLLFGAVNLYESVHSSWVRDYALELTIDHIRQEGKEQNGSYLLIAFLIPGIFSQIGTRIILILVLSTSVSTCWQFIGRMDLILKISR